MEKDIKISIKRDVHKILKIYIAQNDIKTISAGIRDLLLKVSKIPKNPLESTTHALNNKPKVIEEQNGESVIG